MDGDEGVLQFGPGNGLVNQRFLGEIRGYWDRIFNGEFIQLILETHAPCDWLLSLCIIWVTDANRLPMSAQVMDVVPMAGNRKWLMTGPPRTIDQRSDPKFTGQRTGVYLWTQTNDLYRIESLRAHSASGSDTAASS